MTKKDHFTSVSTSKYFLVPENICTGHNYYYFIIIVAHGLKYKLKE